LTGSGSHFRKSPDLDTDPDLDKCSAKFRLKIVLEEICFKKYIHEPKSLTAKVPKLTMVFTHTKKVKLGPFMYNGQNSDPMTRRPDLDPDSQHCFQDLD
jgi:hypothetical protein